MMDNLVEAESACLFCHIAIMLRPFIDWFWDSLAVVGCSHFPVSMRHLFEVWRLVV